jgi:hypothetical protein
VSTLFSTKLLQLYAAPDAVIMLYNAAVITLNCPSAAVASSTKFGATAASLRLQKHEKNPVSHLQRSFFSKVWSHSRHQHFPSYPTHA